MHATHHHTTRVQFAMAGIALLAFMAASSLLLPQVPFLRPVFAFAGFGPRPAGVTVEDKAVARMLALVDTRRDTINALQPAATINTSSTASGVPVLLYHGFYDTTSTGTGSIDGVSVSYDNFITQLSTLAANGWHTVSLADFRDYIEGKKALPAKSFLITFDDGRKDSYYLADPVLQKLGYNAVMFVIGVHIGEDLSPYYLRTPELQAMQSSGRWEIQSHGFNDHNLEQTSASGTASGHFVSDNLWLPDQQRVETDQEHQQRLHDDLVKSQAQLQQTFGHAIYAFAYPFGDYGQPSADRDGHLESMVLEETHKVYELGFAQVDTEGADSDQNIPQANPFLVKRITVSPSWSGQDLLGVLAAGTPKTLPYADALTYPGQWLTGWGSVAATSGTLVLAANPDGTGAMALLKGTEDLNNVRMDATVQVNKGDSFSLVGAYRDEKNYVSCDYAAHTITLRAVVNGVETRRQWWSRNTFQGFGDVSSVDAGIEISPSELACFIHNVAAVTLPGSQNIQAGSVGFKTWSSSLATSLLTIHRVDIKNSTHDDH